MIIFATVEYTAERIIWVTSYILFFYNRRWCPSSSKWIHTHILYYYIHLFINIRLPTVYYIIIIITIIVITNGFIFVTEDMIYNIIIYDVCNITMKRWLMFFAIFPKRCTRGPPRSLCVYTAYTVWYMLLRNNICEMVPKMINWRNDFLR